LLFLWHVIHGHLTAANQNSISNT